MSFKHDPIVPFNRSSETKKQQVARMFNEIAFRYDFLNRFLSAGIDVHWRKIAIRQLIDMKPRKLLDVATGTGDLAIMAHKYLKTKEIIGIDISEKMLELGRKKIAKLLLNNEIQLIQGDSEAINFDDDSFDAVTVAFGVRNFENLEKGLAEMKRVIRKDGKVVILEFSQPRQRLFKPLFNLYMKMVAPGIASWMSTSKEAYQYLSNSVKTFPEGETFLHILNQVGFKETSIKRLSLGICTIYCGRK
ncbi:MAG TPA: bifunctional demethylmenaquinone methyltransferase/2-methoxy-6-polyprenyl-1,4-benzoquinol methylase UbiE [Flavitalea sp.]|nr:bifunctional demethylmenaquinone methyltransferase/2-methoxy-6-polyprenyl-1,4-benzoquinol methylase UbiE [Flavitalea sp.]